MVTVNSGIKDCSNISDKQFEEYSEQTVRLRALYSESTTVPTKLSTKSDSTLDDQVKILLDQKMEDKSVTQKSEYLDELKKVLLELSIEQAWAKTELSILDDSHQLLSSTKKICEEKQSSIGKSKKIETKINAVTKKDESYNTQKLDLMKRINTIENHIKSIILRMKQVDLEKFGPEMLELMSHKLDIGSNEQLINYIDDVVISKMIDKNRSEIAKFIGCSVANIDQIISTNRNNIIEIIQYLLLRRDSGLCAKIINSSSDNNIYVLNIEKRKAIEEHKQSFGDIKILGTILNNRQGTLVTKVIIDDMVQNYCKKTQNSPVINHDSIVQDINKLQILCDGFGTLDADIHNDMLRIIDSARLALMKYSTLANEVEQLQYLLCLHRKLCSIMNCFRGAFYNLNDDNRDHILDFVRNVFLLSFDVDVVEVENTERTFNGFYPVM